MNDKDIISKHLLKRMTIGMARILLGLEIIELDIIESNQQRIEERRADLVALVKEPTSQYILHIEIQNDNQAIMPWRMLRYLTDIGIAHPKLKIKQYLIYIGSAPLNMADGFAETNLSYRYPILDMHHINCETLFKLDTPEALVLAILSDFQHFSDREVVQRILYRLQELTGNDEAAFRENLLMLEILSSNRNLKQILQEEEKMLSQVKYSDLPSYGLGVEQGIEQGIKQGIKQGIDQGIDQGIETGVRQGESIILQNLLQIKFGILPQTILDRLNSANAQELFDWSGRLLGADSLNEVFIDHLPN
jgi:hypothetical protein